MARAAVVWMLVVAARLVYLQGVRYPEFRRQADAQTEKHLAVEALRGSILDRGGQTLAISVPLDSVSVNPMRLPNQEVAADLLSGILSLDRRQLLDRIREAVRLRRGYLSVKKRISPEESERLRSLKLDWIEMRRDSSRQYPKGTLAAHLLGSVGYRDGGTEEEGAAGIEQALDSDLRGLPGVVRVLADSRFRPVQSRVTLAPQPGYNIALTIDERIQFAADREIARAIAAGLGETGTVLVMDPRTGDVLALANYPTYDPNSAPRLRRELVKRTNLAVMAPFEPGSIFKVITLAAALDATSLRPETIIPGGGSSIQVFGQTIHDTKAYGSLPMADVLAQSSNIGAIQVGLRVGARRLHHYIREFGFGERSGILLPGEESGTVRQLDDWRSSSVAYVSMGHEISTTTVQLARAISVIANGGLLVEPRLVHWRQRPGGPREIGAIAPPRRVLKPETAVLMRQMMEGVVLRGTGKKARLAGYTVGGKTGSAQIYDRRSLRYTHRYNASFAGFAPVGDPAIVVVVTLHEATQLGGVVSAPVFREVATAALRVLGVTRDLPDSIPAAEEPVEVNDLAIADARARPPAQAPPPPAGEDEEPTKFLVGPRVPDFHGKSLRIVLAESMELGVQVDVRGAGLARAQSPPAGSILPAGERVRVLFAR